MNENKPDNHPQAPSLAAVSDAQLFRYVTSENLLETASAMKRRARQLRPTISTWIRCAWFEFRTGHQAADELTKRTAHHDRRLADAYAGMDPGALAGERVIVRNGSGDQRQGHTSHDQL